MSALRHPQLARSGIACLAIPSLPLACELAEHPSLAGDPLALADDAGRVAAATSRAEGYGVRVGMTLRDAIGLCPVLAVRDLRPAHVAHIAARLIETMQEVSPIVEEAAPGLVFADLRGTEGMFPDPRAIAQMVLEAVPGGLGTRLGFAGRRFTAQAAAQHAPPGEAMHVPDTEAAAFLAPLPASWLPLAIDVVERLRLLGITTCGDVAMLPRHAFVAQFGRVADRAWRAAQGDDPEPIAPRPWARERVLEHVRTDPPFLSRESMLLAIEQMLGRALRQPRAARRFVRTLRLTAETERGALWERVQVLREPLGDRTRLWTTVRTLVDGAEFPGLVNFIELELGGLTAESGRQASLFSEQTRRREQLDTMVRHLKLRFGQSPIGRVVDVEPWHRLPERRRALLEYDP